MGILQKLFAGSPCDLCKENPYRHLVRLPSRRKVYVCDACRAECDEVFGNPISHVEIETMMKWVDVNRSGTLEWDWGQSRDEIEVLLGLIWESEKTSKSRLLSYTTKIGERAVEVTLRFGEDDGLIEVSLSPINAVKSDFASALMSLYGPPAQDADVAGLSMARGEMTRVTIWKVDGCRVETNRTENGISDILVRPL